MGKRIVCLDENLYANFFFVALSKPILMVGIHVWANKFHLHFSHSKTTSIYGVRTSASQKYLDLCIFMYEIILISMQSIINFIHFMDFYFCFAVF